MLAGAFVDPPARNWIWLLAIARRPVRGGARVGRGRDWDISPAHFTERHGLFVIIALGESLIVAAAAVSAGAAHRRAHERRDRRAGRGVPAVVDLLRLAQGSARARPGARAARRAIGALASTAFSLGHFPLVCGIVAFAVALEEIVHHPSHAPAAEVVVALGAGAVLFVGFSAFALYLAYRRRGAGAAPGRARGHGAGAGGGVVAGTRVAARGRWPPGCS